VIAAALSAAPVAEEKAKKGDDKKAEIVATVNGMPVTKSEWTSIWKADQWHAPTLKAEPSFSDKMAGKPYEDFFFTEEVVKIRAMAHKYKDAVPEMEQTIEAIHAKAAAGEDFAALAKQYSQDSTAPDGGALDEPKEFHQMVFPFNRIAFDLKEGEVSGPFMTIFGYHIVKLEQILPAGSTEGKGKLVGVRHILIRFPSPDPRAESDQLAESAVVEVLDKKLCKKLVSYCSQEG